MSGIREARYGIAIALVLLCGSLHAQGTAASFPARAVRIVVPVPAGGLQDSLARALAYELSSVWGQAVIVDNRPGASGVIGAEFAAKSAPDGHTVFMTDSVTLMTNQFLRRGLPYDPANAFAPVIGIARGSDVLIVNAESPRRSVQELIAAARARPGGLNYGSFGVGSAAHLDTEAFSEAAGIKATHIPYKGGPEIIKAILGGQLDFAFTGVTAALPLIRAGRLRALGFADRQRSPAMPEVPTLVEAGLPYFETGGWFGWLAPAATPQAVIERIAADAGRVIARQEFADRHIRGVALEVLNLQPAAFGELLRETREHFSRRFEALNLKLD